MSLRLNQALGRFPERYISIVSPERSLCAGMGYSFTGVEYGRECYCSNSVTRISGAGQPAPDSDCSVPCMGLGSATCGELSEFVGGMGTLERIGGADIVRLEWMPMGGCSLLHTWRRPV
ncbi:uncharacterized protein EI90DRAFT_3051006 [Cantharellus anzutake]|uniref:uncharacterized protein n=1 Tax=Cantharellus anzutake TaxID=1750568 RepID=UPI001907DC0F|nr:uncharacterized protein EI90DRAFT_3051006 [Cantharellus anzutake]KAF8334100.1 hypothetical protein EI90DRAFT_3051006 [Cantharellus anzutake]